MSEPAESEVLTKLSSIERLLKDIAENQRMTNEILSKVLPSAITTVAQESQFRKIAKDESKSPKQRILAALEYNPDGISLSALSEETKLARNTVRDHVDALVRKGLVRQEPLGGATGKKCHAIMSYDAAVQRLREVKVAPA